MAFRRATPDELRQWTIAMMQALVDGRSPARKKWLKTEIADEIGVDKGSITHILKERQIPGPKMHLGMAKIFGLTDDGMHLAAQEWVKAHPDEMRSELTIARDERYPNRGAAAKAARELGISEQAIRNVCGWVLKASEDPSKMKWLHDMDEEDGRLKRGITMQGAPATVEDEAELKPGPRKK